MTQTRDTGRSEQNHRGIAGESLDGTALPAEQGLVARLAEERDTLRAIMESTHAQVAYLDPQFNFLEVNSAYEQGSRHTREELAGRNHFRLFPNPENQAIFERVRDTGRPAQFLAKPFEFADQPERGTTYWDWRLEPVKDRDGRTRGLVLSLFDVTGRVRVQQELARERDFISAVLDTAGALVIVLDTQGGIVRFNRACEAVTGYSFAEVAGLAFWDLFLSPEEVEPVRAVFARLRAGELPSRFENYWVTRDGRRRLISWSNTVIVDSTGSVEWVIGTGIDVTERRLAQAALRESEENWRGLTEHSPDHIMLLDLDATIRFINRTVPGLSREQVIGTCYHDYALPEFRPVAQACFDRVCETGKPESYESTYVDLAGRTIYFESYVNPVVRSGTVQGLVVRSTDISERKRTDQALRDSEAFNRGIIDNSRDCIKLLDLEGRLKFMSEGGQRLLCIQDVSRYLDMPYETFWQGSDRQATLEAIARARAGQVGRFQGFCATEDGRPKWWDVVISPVFGAGDEVERLLAVSRDITEPRQAEEALRESELKLRTLFDLLPVGVSILDRERQVQLSNPALQQILRLSSEQLQQGDHTARSYLRSDGTPLAAEDLPSARAVREQRPVEGEVGVVTESGTAIWTHVRAAPVPFSDWNVVVATTDVTARKRAEEAARRARDELEQRVQERTAALLEANQTLLAEIAERARIAEELRRSEARLEERVAERTRELASLLEISNAVALSLDLAPLLALILDRLATVVGYDGATIYRLDGDLLQAEVHRGPLPEEVVRSLRLRVERGSAGHHLLHGQVPILVDDVHADTPAARALREVAGERFDTMFGYLASWLGIPLTVKDRVTGLLALQSRKAKGFELRQAALVQAFAGQAAVALENSRLHQQTQLLAALEERQRLARELHDAVSQTLFSASLAADVLPRLWERDREAGLRCLDEVHQLTRGALAEMRTLLLELRPSALVATPLAELLKQLAEATGGRGRLPVTLVCERSCPLPAEVQVGLYRLAQEALNNIAKHAAASTATVELRCDSRSGGKDGEAASWVELSIADDGCGFDPAKAAAGKGLGLGIMHERAEAIGASLAIESQPGRGTFIRVLWRSGE